MFAPADRGDIADRAFPVEDGSCFTVEAQSEREAQRVAPGQQSLPDASGNGTVGTTSSGTQLPSSVQDQAAGAVTTP
jgi:hypothetical protein